MNASDTHLMRALHGKPTARVPFWEVYFKMDGLAEQLLGKPVSDLADQVSLARYMGWEHLFVNLRHNQQLLGVPGEIASDGTSHYVAHGKIPLDEIYSRPHPDFTSAIERASQVAHIAREEDMAVIAYLSTSFHAVNTALGLEHFSYLLYDEPEYIDTLLDFAEEIARRAIREVIVPLGIDLVLVEVDCAYKNGLMLNPQLFRHIFFDRTAATVDLLRSAGITYAFHTDGKVDEFIPTVVELGGSGIHGIEAQANDLGDIKRRFGHDLTLIGNMDVVFLTNATVDEVRAETIRMLDIGTMDGRYIAACNTSPMDYIPRENYLAMVDVIKNY